MIQSSLKTAVYRCAFALCSLSVLAPASAVLAASPNYPASPDPRLDRLISVYQIVPFDQTVPPNLKATGTLDDIALTPKAEEQSKLADLRWDPATNCRLVGPFRMMAMPDNRIELLPTLTGGLFMRFQNISLGNRRRIEFADKHSDAARPSYEGESIAHWKGEDLVVDTTGFNDVTWLNGHGAPHDTHLHMVETFHLLPGAQYLQVTVTIDDPSFLTKPYTYTRYYQKQDSGIGDYFCEEDHRQN